MFLGTAQWGSAFAAMYGEMRDGVAVAVVYYGKVLDGGKITLQEKVFPSRAAMRAWVNTSGKLVARA